MKRVLWIMAILLSLSASTSVWAGEIRHKVVDGDCLGKLHVRYHVPVKSIQERNYLGNSTVIKLGSVLWIPVVEKTEIAKVKIQTPEKPVAKAEKPQKEVDKIRRGDAVVYLGIRKYNPENSGRDKTICSPGFAAYLLGVIRKEDIKDTKVILDSPYDPAPIVDPNKLIQKGDEFKMTSGLNKVGDYEAGFNFFVQGANVYLRDKFITRIYWRPSCGNWIRHEEKPIPTSPPVIEEKPTLPPVTVTPPAEEPPSIFVNKKEEERILIDQELDVGGGLWRNDDNSGQGGWWFLQYKLYLHQLETDFAGGTLTPVVGAFARGDLGKTNADFKWNNAGFVGPQAGEMWNALTDAGYPQQVQVMFRTLWEHLHGENPTSGYAKTEDHFLLGLYAEYLRQFAPDLMHILYAEGWTDVASSFKSTWSGDKASSRTSFAVGYKLHKQWNDEWASRFGVSFGWAEQDSRWSAGANIEMRYNDWLMFGPSLDYTLASAIQGAAGHFSYGPFVRAEFHEIVKEEHSKSQSEGVQPSDKPLILY